MAELLMATGWVAADSWLADLRSILPDEYFVVTDPVVHGVSLAAIVVGPQGLIVLHAKDWQGRITPASPGPWLQEPDGGEPIQQPNPSQEVAAADRALARFLKDEFPDLRPAVWHWLVLTDPSARVEVYGASNPVALKVDGVAQEIAALTLPDGAMPLNDAPRAELASGLQDRQLTRTQRASHPFMFRSGGVGAKAWTLQAVISYMERHPDDGIYHLRNGTLARWFSDEGAKHLATLAREVTEGPQRNARVTLETFLVRSGLTRRRAPVARPRRIRMDDVLVGGAASRRLVIETKRRGGYLDGSVATTQPWLRVEPRTLTGVRGELLVMANTEGLLIRETPHDSQVVFESSISGERTVVPVRVRVQSRPSPLVRYGVRPLVGLALMGLLGVAVGWAQGLWGIDPPSWLPFGLAYLVPPIAFWGALVGLGWAALGGLRGWRQPEAWPLGKALSRHLVRVAAWGAALGLAAAAILWVVGAWGLERVVISGGIPEAVRVGIVVFAVALGIVPATVGEILSAEDPADADIGVRRRLWRPIRMAAVSVVLALLLVGGARLAEPALLRYDIDGLRMSLRDWGGEQWTHLESGLDTLWKSVQLRYYDRRAPLRPTPEPTSLEESARAPNGDGGRRHG